MTILIRSVLCIAEFLGTGLFIFFGTSVLCAALAGASFGLWEICLVWGLGIALAVYLTSGISGAHLNPAVTISLWMFASFSAKKCCRTFWRRWLLVRFVGGTTFTCCITIFCLKYEPAHQMVRGSEG